MRQQWVKKLYGIFGALKTEALLPPVFGFDIVFFIYWLTLNAVAVASHRFQTNQLVVTARPDQ